MTVTAIFNIKTTSFDKLRFVVDTSNTNFQFVLAQSDDLSTFLTALCYLGNQFTFMTTVYKSSELTNVLIKGTQSKGDVGYESLSGLWF